MTDPTAVNVESTRAYELIKSHVSGSLVKVGVPIEDQKWTLEVDAADPDVEIRVTCRVKDVTARQVFGTDKVEALRSRMTRAAQNSLVTGLGWVSSGSKSSMWKDPDLKFHWTTIVVTLRRRFDDEL